MEGDKKRKVVMRFPVDRNDIWAWAKSGEGVAWRGLLGTEKGQNRWGSLFAKINEAFTKILEATQVSINRIMTKQMIERLPLEWCSVMERKAY